MRTFLLLATSLFFGAQASAHALWIETAVTGQKGKAQTVTVFYGEYADGTPDKVSAWYSDVKSFSLWLLTPDQRRIQLPLAAADDRFTATFTPEKEGAYQLEVSHDAKDLGKTTKYQFNTSAAVLVGKPGKEGASSHQNPLRLTANGDRVNKPVTVQGFFNGVPSGKTTLTIVSPNGWTKTVKANAEGVAEFVPEKPGKYMLEMARTDEEKGEHHGKTYDHVWRCATQFVEVK